MKGFSTASPNLENHGGVPAEDAPQGVPDGEAQEAFVLDEGFRLRA